VTYDLNKKKNCFCTILLC